MSSDDDASRKMFCSLPFSQPSDPRSFSSGAPILIIEESLRSTGGGWSCAPDMCYAQSRFYDPRHRVPIKNNTEDLFKSDFLRKSKSVRRKLRGLFILQRKWRQSSYLIPVETLCRLDAKEDGTERPATRTLFLETPPTPLLVQKETETQSHSWSTSSAIAHIPIKNFQVGVASECNNKGTVAPKASTAHISMNGGFRFPLQSDKHQRDGTNTPLVKV